MELPDYFLADLGPEATLSPAMVREACQALRRNRQQHLSGRATSELIHILAEVAAHWRRTDYPLRQHALRAGPAATGFSAPVLASGLDSFFEQITVDNLESLVHQDTGCSDRLDDWGATESELEQGRKARVYGPELLAHCTAGNIPLPAMTSLLLGILTRSAQFLKCARGASLLPRLFAHSIYEEDRKLASCLELAEWPGGEREDLEAVLFEEADAVTATGRDETLQLIRQRLSVRKTFLGYGHKISFAFVAKEALTRAIADRWVRAAAEDIAAWDQLGCLSPHCLYVEDGGGVSAEMFAERLAEELERKEETHPRGKVDVETAAFLQARRGLYQVRADADDHTRLWTSSGSTAWTVVHEQNPLFQTSCLHRFVYVKPVRDVPEMLKNAEPVRDHVSTIGLGAAGSRARDIASALAAWGARRVCPLGRMQRPPLGWRHDGRPPLGDLLRWVDWETDRT